MRWDIVGAEATVALQDSVASPEVGRHKAAVGQDENTAERAVAEIDIAVEVADK